eukprot:8644358-Pyramimonas_sp.AAC.2
MYNIHHRASITDRSAIGKSALPQRAPNRHSREPKVPIGGPTKAPRGFKAASQTQRRGLPLYPKRTSKGPLALSLIHI